MALAIFAIALAGLAPVLVRCTTLLVDARSETRALELATSRLEQLRALPLQQDAASFGLDTDTSTNLSRDPPSDDGTGLRPGSGSSAWIDVGDRFDYLRADGQLAPTTGTAFFVRRWAVVDLSNGSADRLLLHVFARDSAGEWRLGTRSSPTHAPGDVWLFTLRARSLR